ncbi:FAD binding domain-containing protein [Sarocladium implicatum]|nr:FAD binding domain-containing protein [Sarocladium implicatum]
MSQIPTDVDLLIIGGGMAGLSAALHAATANPSLRILLTEKTSALGGSSQYSSGMFWAPRTVELAHKTIPYGDPALQEAIVKEHPVAVQWMRDQGIRVSDKFEGIMSIGVGYPTDIPAFHKLAKERIEGNKNATILTETWAVALTQAHRTGPVTGATIVSAKTGEATTITAKSVILATGGFQGSPRLTSTLIGNGADNLFVRSNVGNTGDGFTLATEAGAGHTRGMNTFYGHLLPSPLQARDVNPFDFLKIAQFQSGRGVLVNQEGRRFCDETMGDEVSNQEVAKQTGKKAYLILNEEVYKKYAVGEPWPNAGNVDRVEEARRCGGNVATASSTAGLISVLGEYGVPASTVKKTIESFNEASAAHASGEPVDFSSLDAPLGTNNHGAPPHAPLTDSNAPFWVVEVQPSLTLTYGGIKVNKECQALTQNSRPVKGLWVAGIDAGGFSNYRYCAGLLLGFATGKWAAESAAKESSMSLEGLKQAL